MGEFYSWWWRIKTHLVATILVILVLTLVALIFQRATTRTERHITQQRYENDQRIVQQRYEQDQQIALDKQREDLLQTYLDRMSELLLKEGLRSSAVDAEVRNVARARTITLLFQLDARRIGYVFAFYVKHDSCQRHRTTVLSA